MTKIGSIAAGRRAVAALAFGSALVTAVGAHAGACPEDQVLADHGASVDAVGSVGVDRELLSSIDLTGWRDMGNFMLRMRRLTIAPHGLVPTHTHDDRPSIVYVLNGELIEHNAHCAVPIRHLAGEWAAEAGEGHTHWWENPTDEAVVVLSADIVPFQRMDDNNM